MGTSRMHHPKMTGHFQSLLLGLCLAFPVAWPASAAELRLSTANDPISGKSGGDDLYTAAVVVEVDAVGHRWTVGERMFTDKQRGRRFDETYLEAARELPSWRGWDLEVAAGALHVGKGLLGERVQNQVHRWVGSERLHLDYADTDPWHLTLASQAQRPLLLSRRAVVTAHLQAFASPGFQRWLRAELRADLDLGAGFGLRLGAGGRGGAVDTELLADHVASLAPTYELGVSWRAVELRYSSNDYGTATRHLTLTVRVPHTLGSSRSRGGPSQRTAVRSAS